MLLAPVTRWKLDWVSPSAGNVTSGYRVQKWVRVRGTNEADDVQEKEMNAAALIAAPSLAGLGEDTPTPGQTTQQSQTPAPQPAASALPSALNTNAANTPVAMDEDAKALIDHERTKTVNVALEEVTLS